MKAKNQQAWPLDDGLRITGTRQKLRVTAWMHLVSTVLLILWNYVSNAGIFEKNVGEVSRELDNVFTPASYAFAIWGPIYLGLLALGIYEVRLAQRPMPGRGEIRDDERFILALGPWFVMAQVVCGLWLAAWLTGAVFLSLICMTLLLAFLLVCVFRTNMERWDAPTRVILFLWWPLSLYSGWISVAFFANVSAYLAHLGSPVVQQSWWALALGVIIVVIHASMVWLRNMREFSMVGAWALVALSVRHADNPELSTLSLAALTGAILLLVNGLAHAWLNFTVPPDLERRRVAG